jgi:predicted nucleic acid-binding protein
MPLKRVFIDTWYLIALLNPKDNAHKEAVELQPQLEGATGGIVVTDAVLMELGNFYGSRGSAFRNAAAELIALALRIDDAPYKLAFIDQSRLQRAVELFAQHQDKQWSLTDCSSMVVMEDFGIREIATGDGHFREAQFDLLMTERFKGTPGNT